MKEIKKEEIIKALIQADDIAISEEVDCFDVLNYIKELRIKNNELGTHNAICTLLDATRKLLEQGSSKGGVWIKTGDLNDTYSILIQKEGLGRPIDALNAKIDSLSVELGQAKAYIDGLEYVRAENEQLKEMYRMTVAIQEDKCEFTLDSEYAMIVEKGIINMFKKGGATNFLQLTVGDPENTEDKYSICIQKVEGMSPAEHFNSLREEIVNLTAAKEAVERDKANLERTIEEIYEALKANGITIDADGNVNDSRVEQAKKQAAKEILQELINIMNAKCDNINSDELHYVIHKYDVEVDE